MNQAKGTKGTSPKKQNTGGQKKGKKPPRYTGKKLILYRCYIALTILSAIIVAGYIGVRLFLTSPPVVATPELTRPPITTSAIDEVTGEEIIMEIPSLSADRKDQFYTFLVVGQSQETGGGLTDTMIFVAYDVANQKLSLMSLPRDTYVERNGRRMLLNAVYTSAGGGEKGEEALKKEVQKLTGVLPDFCVTAQWEAVGELVDAIGGVYFEVPFDMYYNDLSQHFKIDLKKGYQLLNGDQAMQLIRYRHNSVGDTGQIDSHYGYAEGDLGRIKTQQAFLKSLISQCLQMDNIMKNLTNYIEIFKKNVDTDLSIPDLTYFAWNAMTGLDMDNVTFVTLPNKSAGDSHLVVIPSQIVTVVNENFNPYKEDIRQSELSVVTSIPQSTASASTSAAPSPSASASAAPSSEVSQEPGSEEEPLLPGGTAATASPSPSSSQKPSQSPAASSPASPTSSASPSQTPAATEPPAATPSAAPTPAPTQAPAATQTSEEPLLPPGV